MPTRRRHTKKKYFLILPLHIFVVHADGITDKIIYSIHDEPAQNWLILGICIIVIYESQNPWYRILMKKIGSSAPKQGYFYGELNGLIKNPVHSIQYISRNDFTVLNRISCLMQHDYF